MGGDREIERVLDEALACYTDVEPLAGLEERILQRVRRDAGSSPGWRNAVWALAALSIALLLGFVVMHQVKPQAVQAPLVAKRTDVLPISIPERVQKPIPRRHRSKRAALPEQDEFPARTPMTPEEKALARLWNRAPAAATNLFADLHESAAAPIAVEPVETNNTNGRKGSAE